MGGKGYPGTGDVYGTHQFAKPDAAHDQGHVLNAAHGSKDVLEDKGRMKQLSEDVNDNRRLHTLPQTQDLDPMSLERGTEIRYNGELCKVKMIFVNDDPTVLMQGKSGEIYQVGFGAFGGFGEQFAESGLRRAGG